MNDFQPESDLPSRTGQRVRRHKTRASKAGILWLFAIIVLLGGTATWLVTRSTTPAQTLASYVLYSLLAASVLFGVLGATGWVQSRTFRFGGSAALFVVVLTILPRLMRQVDGTVTIQGTILLDNVPVPKATISLLHIDAGGMTQEVKESENSQFKFAGVRLENQNLEFNVKIPGYYDTPAKYRFTNSHRVILRLTRDNLRKIPVLHKPEALVAPSTYGFTKPPVIQTRIETDRRRPEIEARFDKARNSESESYKLSSGEIKLEQRGQTEWTALIDTEKLIQSKYRDLPYGLYRAVLSVPPIESGRTQSLDVNYVFKGDFRQPRSVFEADSRYFKILPDSSLEVWNPNKSNSVSASLKQTFDFGTDFAVKGWFVIGPVRGARSARAALDVTLNERISFLMGEDPGDSYTIKVGNEEPQALGPSEERNKVNQTKLFIHKDSRTRHTFEIRVTRSERRGTVKCSLFIATNAIPASSTDPKWRECITRRDLDPNVLGGRLSQIRLRLWGNGSAVIRDVEVAELPKKS
jgi:hypothetical protein